MFTCVWRVIFILQLEFHQELEDSSASTRKQTCIWTNSKSTSSNCAYKHTRVDGKDWMGNWLPCVGRQAAQYMCEGGQGESAGLLHQDWVFIGGLLCVVLERHTLPPQPVKLALLELVPHCWTHKGNQRGCSCFIQFFVCLWLFFKVVPNSKPT